MTPGLQWVSLMLRTRIEWAGRHWALPFLTALVPAARYDRRKGRRHKMVTDYAQQMLVCLRRWLPDRDLVVCDGGYAKREFRLRCQTASLPEQVKAHRRRNQTAPRRVPVPARATMAARPDWPPPGGRSATAQSDSGAGRPHHPMDPIPCHRVRRQLRHGRADFGRGAVVPRRAAAGFIRWVVVRHLAEPLGPYALLCTDVAAEPLRILQCYLLRWQVEVTFEELAGPPGHGNPAPVVGTDHRAYYPALFGLFSVVTLAVVTLAADVLIGQQGGMAPRATAWYDKTSPSFADAIALVRRYRWVQQGTFRPSGREHESMKIPRLLYRRMIDTLSYAA